MTFAMMVTCCGIAAAKFGKAKRRQQIYDRVTPFE
jgi:hypothetical protein